MVAAGVVAATMNAGCGSEQPAQPALPVIHPEELLVVENAPESSRNHLLVLPGGTVCMPGEYLARISCYQPERSAWIAFGQEGQGPGELKIPGPLVTVEDSDSLVGIIDLGLRRMTILRFDGGYVRSRPTPFPFFPLSGVSAGRITGFTPTPPGAHGSTDFEARVTVLELSAGDDQPVITLRARRPGGQGSAIGLGRGVALPDGIMIFHVHDHRFARFDASGRLLGEFEYPRELQRPLYPSKRDLEKYRSDLTRMGSSPTEAQIRTRAATPSPPILPGLMSMQLGPGHTILVGAARDREGRSYIDVFYEDGRYAGALAIDGRLLAFNVLNDTLVALVERPYDGGDMPPRDLRWYRLTDLFHRPT